MSLSQQFNAAVAKVQTLADGGLRVSLDLPESQIIAAAWLMECKRQELPLKLVAQVDDAPMVGLSGLLDKPELDGLLKRAVESSEP